MSVEDLFCFGICRENRNRWLMKWGRDRKELYCVKGRKQKEIVFREISLAEEKALCKDIIENYHYIHCNRCDRQKGIMFSFFIRGEKLPFAIEEIEPCSISRNYKKAVLRLIIIPRLN